MQDFRNLAVWQRVVDLTGHIFEATGQFPKSGDGNLRDQLRKAVVSIGLNIAEGCGRKGGADFLRFLHISQGSASEVEGGLELARQLRYLESSQFKKLLGAVTEVRKMLTGLMKSLGANWGPDSPPPASPS